MTAPVAGYPLWTPWDQCRAQFCDQPGDEHVKGDEDVQLLCHKHMEQYRSRDECKKSSGLCDECSKNPW